MYGHSRNLPTLCVCLHYDTVLSVSLQLLLCVSTNYFDDEETVLCEIAGSHIDGAMDSSLSAVAVGK